MAEARTPRAGTVLCAGRLYADLVFTGLDTFPAPGREVYAQAMALVPGGGAFITAAHLTGLGRPAALLARLGTDPLARACEGALARTGIDLGPLERTAEAGPQVTVAVATAADRAFVTRRVGPALPADLDTALAAPSVIHLHIGELATLLEVPDLPARARARGLTVSLDCSWDDRALADPRALAGLTLIDVFLPNEAEALALTRTSRLDAALDRLAPSGGVVAVKRGAAGAVLACGALRLALPAPGVAVRDTTGAGDAFDAGFLAAWLDGRPLACALARGIAAGSAAVQRIGGAEPPVTEAEVARLAAAIDERARAPRAPA